MRAIRFLLLRKQRRAPPPRSAIREVRRICESNVSQLITARFHRGEMSYSVARSDLQKLRSRNASCCARRRVIRLRRTNERFRLKRCPRTVGVGEGAGEKQRF